MACWPLLLAVGAALAGTALASSAGDTAAPGPPQPAGGSDTQTDRLPVDRPATEDNDINRNNIFGTSCASGLVSANGQCVHTEGSQSPQVPPTQPGGGPEYDDSDDDAFLRSLIYDDPLLPADDDPSMPTVTEPVTTSTGPDLGAAIPGVGDFIDSLSDEQFLRELLRGTGEQEGSPAPSEAPHRPQPPAPGTTCDYYRQGVVLVSIGSVSLVLALALTTWALMRWRGHRAQVGVTV